MERRLHPGRFHALRPGDRSRSAPSERQNENCCCSVRIRNKNFVGAKCVTLDVWRGAAHRLLSEATNGATQKTRNDVRDR